MATTHPETTGFHEPENLKITPIENVPAGQGVVDRAVVITISPAQKKYARYNKALRLTLKEKFFLLKEIWLDERPSTSSLTKDLINHPAYETIIQLGIPVIPLILKDLDDRLLDWFPALERITGENPVPPEHYGNLSAMRSFWQQWGEERGYY